MIKKLFAKISWSKKIFAISTFFLLGMLLIGGVASYLIYSQNHKVHVSVEDGQRRMTAANEVHVAVVQMAAAQNAIISADDDDSVRKAAIGAIRAGAMLDESLKLLETELVGSEDVRTITQAIQHIRPEQMKIVMQVRSGDKNSAISIAHVIAEDGLQIEQMSRNIVATEKAHMDAMVADVEELGMQAIQMIISFMILGLIIGIVVTLVFSRMLTNPLKNLEAIISRLSERDFTVTVPDMGIDEVGRTALATGKTVSAMREVLEALTKGSHRLSQDAETLENSSGQMYEASQKLDQSVSHIQTEAVEVQNAATIVSQSLSRAVSSTRESNEITTSMVEGVTSISARFGSFQTRMEEASVEAARLVEVSSKISSITSTISQISEQTSLLALNAAIEAARAGDAGRGFAVVADEVRTLSEQTASAVTEIGGLIKQIESQITETSQMLHGIVDEAEENVTAIGEIATMGDACAEQTRNSESSMSQLKDIVESQASSIVNVTNSINAVATHSEDVRQLSSVLRELSRSLAEEGMAIEEISQRFTI